MFRITKAGAAFRLLCLALMAALAGCREDSHAQQQHASPPPSVIVALAERVDINPRSEYVGQTVAVDTVDVRARVQAFLVRRAFVEGRRRQRRDAAVQSGAGALRGRGRGGGGEGGRAARSPGPHPPRPGARAHPLWAGQRQPAVARPGDRRPPAGGSAAAGQRGGSAAGADQPRLHQHHRPLRRPHRPLRPTASASGSGRTAACWRRWSSSTRSMSSSTSASGAISTTCCASSRRRARVRRAPDYVPRLRLANGVEYHHAGPARPSSTTWSIPAPGPSPSAPSSPTRTSCWCRDCSSPSLLDQAEAEAGAADTAGGGAGGSGRDASSSSSAPTTRSRCGAIETGARVGVRWAGHLRAGEGERVIYEGIQKVRPGIVVAPMRQAAGRPGAG